MPNAYQTDVDNAYNTQELIHGLRQSEITSGLDCHGTSTTSLRQVILRYI